MPRINPETGDYDDEYYDDVYEAPSQPGEEERFAPTPSGRETDQAYYVDYPGPTGSGANYRAPAGVPQDWAEDFLRRNPGDYARVTSAYTPTGHRGFESQGPAYDPATNQLRPAYAGFPNQAAYNLAMPRPAGQPGYQAPQSNYAAVFSDPLTKQYEQLLQAQLALYQQQQAAMQQAAAAAEQRRASTGAAVDRLTGYVNERVGKLQGPAYTGTEQEVLRTQFLDPLERDRSAAHQRAIQQISARGLTPESGISQELMRQVDQEFNKYRTQGQGAIATRQIEEQRSREQEAQELLKYLTMLPDAVARGDLDFVAYVQSLISQPGQQGLTVGKLAADLPGERLREALAALGIGGGGGDTSAQLLQLLAQQQQQRQYQNAINAQAWGNIGLGLGG